MLNLCLKSGTTLYSPVFELVSAQTDYEGFAGLVLPQSTEECSGGLSWHEVRTQPAWTQTWA